jgi:hypothetical protein
MSAALFLLLPALLAAQIASIEVADTAGLRRFGYPVRARIRTSIPAGSLQLLADGKPVDAQFTPMDGGETEIDFVISLGPWEKRRLTVQKGVARPISGPMRVEQSPASYAVRYPGGLTFHIPKDLQGLFHAVETPAIKYLLPGSGGLILGRAPNSATRALAASSRIVKSGPLACALQFEGAVQVSNRPVKSVVHMEFPRSKSWVNVRWTVDGPDAAVNRLAAEVNLSVEGQPLIVDFGANTMVYATVRSGQSAIMQTADYGWKIDVNGQTYAAAPNGQPEGWAHVMDRSRATAIAVEGFAVMGSSIEISSEGRVRIERDRQPGGPKTLSFWLHFVPMPVQIGAATSPQSMMRPLSVRVA